MPIHPHHSSVRFVVFDRLQVQAHRLHQSPLGKESDENKLQARLDPEASCVMAPLVARPVGDF